MIMKVKFYHVFTVCLILTVAMIICLASCTSPSTGSTTSPNEITDQLGRSVVIDSPPQRIVSLAPSNTEILFALGLADRVVAVTDYCNYPPEVKNKPSIGGFSTPNIEEIVALSPDLVLATSIHESKIIPQLEDKGLTVLALDPKTIDEVLEAISLTGRVADVNENASELLAGMRQRIKLVTDKTDGLSPEQKPRTFYIVWHDPLKAAGVGTLQDELIAKAGGINIVQELRDYAGISLETVIMANPKVIIVGAGHGSSENQTFMYAKAEPRLSETDARQYDRVYAVDADLASRPGPRIVDGLEKFAQFIHPELFD